MVTQISRHVAFPLVVALTVFGLSVRGYSQLTERKTDKENVPQLSVKSVAENPEQYLGKTLRVTGRLENKGTNYFTDLRVVLKDDQCNFVYVRPWLPTELPPSPPGYTGERRPVLSQYLGNEVELTTVLERGTLKKVGEVYLLKVKSAKVLR